MPRNDVLFVLGAYNAEMVMAKKLLSAVGLPFTSATKEGKLTTARNAYFADGVKTEPTKNQAVVFMCCNVKGLRPHRALEPLAGNPTHDLGSPELFWGSSAIGQLVSSLISDDLYGGGRENAQKIAPMLWEARMAAASEHYLSEAYRGLCPGVNPVALRLWRAMNRAEYLKKTPREIMDLTDSAINALETCPVVELPGGVYVRRVTEYIPEMYEAAALIGDALTYTRSNRDKGEKVTLINASSATIEAWATWAMNQESGLTDVYASPDKGYAGANVVTSKAA